MYRATYNSHSKNVRECTQDEWDSRMSGFIEHLDTFQSNCISLAIVTRDTFQKTASGTGGYTNINSTIKADQ